MKKNRFNTILAILALLFTNPLWAHFGSKGLTGGTVITATVNDTMVYLGTESGGVFQNTKKTLTGWSAKPVGLLSGKINALAHTGTYLFAAAGDKGVFRFKS